jgi:hypothetical protein
VKRFGEGDGPSGQPAEAIHGDATHDQGRTISSTTTSAPTATAEITSVRRRNRLTARNCNASCYGLGLQEVSVAKELVLDLAIRYGFQVLGALVILAAVVSWRAGWAS